MFIRRVLFLCTGNSARSQMAEGLVNHFLGNHWQAYSAGTAPTGYVHPMAVRVMGELGIDLSGYRSKSVDEFREVDFDRVVTVCDDAAENCPVWLGQGCKVHLGFPDPARTAGNEAEQLNLFRKVRDDIRHKVLALLETRTGREDSGDTQAHI
ncbi:MAG: protein tyrosine phosphatase [Chloroflexi bacterium RBG_16_57_9]|nr:MAG: protein tyrosine phosphatase [Chloroflexi bacterium RBG_16_57_9]